MGTLSSNEIPSNWPTDVKYTTRNIYSKGIPSHVLTQITGKATAILANSNTKVPAQTAKYVANVAGVKIKIVTEKSHPACGQRGLFAAKKLKPGSHVLDYMGFVHTDKESNSNSDYDIALGRYELEADGSSDTKKYVEIAIDAMSVGNEARMVNDYRGIATKPNVKFDEHLVQGEYRIGIFVMDREIKKGEELLISYGKGTYKKEYKYNYTIPIELKSN